MWKDEEKLMSIDGLLIVLVPGGCAEITPGTYSSR
jgi:hypothetical protein